MSSQIKITTVDGQVLDLFQGVEAEFYITRQIHDLQNLETRNADYTKALEIPGTPNNLNILYGQSIGDAAGRLTDKLEVSIEMGGVMVAPIAYLLYESTNNIQGVLYLQVTIFYGNFNLFDSLLPGTIDEMNWADLAITWDPVNVATITNNSDSMVFAYCDWYGDSYFFGSTREGIDLNMASFWMYTKEIIRRIMAEAGYILEVHSAPAEFDKMAISCLIDKFINPTIFEGVSIRAEALNTVLLSVDGATARAQFDQVNAGNIWSLVNYEFLFTEANTITASMTGKVTYTEGNPNNAPGEIRIYHNAAEIANLLFPDDGTNETFYFSVQANVLAGDTVWAEIFADTGPNNSTLTLEINTLFSVSTPAHGV